MLDSLVTVLPALMEVGVPGLASGVLAGVLLRASDAESAFAARTGFRGRFMRALHAPGSPGAIILSLLAVCVLLFVLLKGPLLLVGDPQLCQDYWYVWKGSLIVGVLGGWYIRYLLFRLLVPSI